MPYQNFFFFTFITFVSSFFCPKNVVTEFFLAVLVFSFFRFSFPFFCWQSLIWALCSQGLWIVCTLCEPQFYTRYAYFLKCSSLGWTLQKGFLWLLATVFCDFLCCWAHKAFSLVSEYPKLLFWPLLRIYLSLWWISFDFAAHVYIYLYNYLIWQLFWRYIVGSQKRLQNGNAMLGINFRPFTFLEVAHVYPWNSFGMNCPTKREALKTRSRFNWIMMHCCAPQFRVIVLTYIQVLLHHLLHSPIHT